MPTYTVTCQTCSKTFTAYRKNSLNAPKYCNRECYGNARAKPNPPINCPACRQKFIPGRNGKGNKYCSQKCYVADRQGKPTGRKKDHPEFICETCDNIFTVYPSRLDHGDGPPRYCSTDCFYKWLKGSKRAPRIKVKCLTCGKTMQILKSRYDIGQGRYCSQQCMIKDRPSPKRKERIQCSCLHCGDIFYRLPCQMKNGRGQFCSKGCNAAYTIRHLYTSPTSIEQALIDELDSRNIDYKSQYPLKGWIIDFAFPIYKLAVEADGIYWHSLPNVQAKDTRKDADLTQRGWTILHFTGDEIRASASACVDEIIEHLT